MRERAFFVVLVFGLAVVAAAQVSTQAQAIQTVPASAQPVPSADRALAREILEELVEIPTTEGDGTARAAQTIAARLVEAQHYVERLAPRRRQPLRAPSRTAGCTSCATGGAQTPHGWPSTADRTAR